MSWSPSDGNLVRDIQSMPEFVHDAIAARGVMRRYRERPAYQRNDYLTWISKAKLEATRQKRLAQMLDELERGGVYMHMKWNGG